ncbi:MAG: hypothetical protein HYX33_01500 [Actinobacteria bacterium]|nr:hypothetical protein [Actinomycetota bacterium]
MRARTLAMFVGVASLAIGGSARSAPAPIVGIQDDRLTFSTLDPAVRMARVAALGARLVRVDLRWDRVAPRRPMDARDPADPAYDWARMDAVVNAARARRIEVLFTVWGTPTWARDPAITDSGPFDPSAIRPGRPEDLGEFAAAAARRYAPLGVRRWEAWNEPNIPLFLIPQFAPVGDKWVNVSAETYSAMATSFYVGVKSVDPGAIVAGAVTAPVGERCPTYCPNGSLDRTYPIDFLMLLDRPGLRPPMDAVSHHPYPQSGPRAYDFAGSTYVDIYNIDRFERAVDRTYLRGKPLWLTELGFSTAPTANYNTYFRLPQQAEYLADSYQRLRRNARVKLVSWYFLQDNAEWTSGLLRADATAKPSARAFAFPVAPTVRVPVPPRSNVVVLGQLRLAPGPALVTIERRLRTRWRVERRVRTGRDGSFAVTLRPRVTATYRARFVGRSTVSPNDRRVSATFAIRVSR